MSHFTESTIEAATLARLSDLGRQIKHGAEIAPDGLFAVRQDYGRVVLDQRLRDALLPKLISGEIRVKDTEKLIGESL